VAQFGPTVKPELNQNVVSPIAEEANGDSVSVSGAWLYMMNPDGSIAAVAEFSLRSSEAATAIEKYSNATAAVTATVSNFVQVLVETRESLAMGSSRIRAARNE